MGAGVGAAPEMDRYGGWPAISGAKSGFFGVQKLRDRWWFTTPEGSAFLSRGVEAIQPAPGEPPTQVRRRLAEWGFNTAGPASSPQVRGDGIAYTVVLNLSAPTIAAGARPPGRNFPDVFDPRFERIANEIAGNVCPLHADDPWLLGYYTDEGLQWRGDDGATPGSAGGGGGEDLAAAYFGMPAEAPGKRALVAELKRLYADEVGAFARSWGVPVRSFDDLLAMRELRPGARYKGFVVSRDRAALVALIAARYFEVAKTAIRAHDPKHLLLGCRFARPPGSEALAAMRGRMDAAWVADGPELSPEVLTQMHNDCGLPLLVGPLTVAASAGALVPPSTSAEALGEGPAREYAARVERLAKQAFVVGYAWPRYGRVSATATDAGCELTDGDRRSDTLLATAIAKTNADFYGQASMARLKPTIFDVVGRYDLRRAAEGGIRVDGDLAEWAGAVPMELRPSAYDSEDTGVEATAYLMWDTGAVYIAGQLYDEATAKSTLTAYVGADWVELGAANYCFYVTLQPGAQTVTDGKGRTRPADLVLGRIYARGEGPTTGGDSRGASPGGRSAAMAGGAGSSAAGGRRVAGYTFEARVVVPVPIPEGFVFHFGLALHHYTKDGREVRLSFPYYWSGSSAASCAECIVAGRGR
jgi:agarase